MSCKICGNEVSKKSHHICHECYQIKHKIKCLECGRDYSLTANYFSKIDKNHYKCKACKLKGVGNPNYGKRWTQEKRDKQSKTIKNIVNDTFRKNCSKGMKGKKMSVEAIEKMKRTVEINKLNGYKRKPLSEESKKLIGIKSAEKFSKEFLIKQRKIQEERGHWIKLEEKDDFIFYKQLADWRGIVITEHTVGVDLLKSHQFKSKVNNTSDSLIRDHMYGRRAGHRNGIFPELIRHPANCQLLTHSSNIKKSKLNNDTIITINDLFKRILNWKLDYNEQTLCLKLIEDYINGIRYCKEKYIKNYHE